MNLLQNDGVEGRHFTQQQQITEPYHQITNGTGTTTPTVLQHHQSAAPTGHGGFNCRQCGKAEYRNGEFATIKLGDIFTHIDNFPSATSSETLCASCACVNDAAASVAAGARHRNQNIIQQNHYINGPNNINNNEMSPPAGLKPLTNGTHTIVSTMDYHAANNHQLKHPQVQGQGSSNSNGPGLVGSTVLHRISGAYGSPGLGVNIKEEELSPRVYSDNNNTEAINHVMDNPNHVYLTVLSSNNGESETNVPIPVISQTNQLQQNAESQGQVIQTTPTTYKILAGGVIGQTPQNPINTVDAGMANKKPDVVSEEVKGSTKGGAELKEEPPRVPCTLCKKLFKNQRMASIHLKRVHEKVNRFVCEICGVGFSYRGSLDSHLASHNPPAVTHDCPTCGQKFKEKSNLNKHIRYHTENPKKFLCEHCPSGFSKRVNLRYHIKRKHPEVAMNNNTIPATAPIIMAPGYFPADKNPSSGIIHQVEASANNNTSMTPPLLTTLTPLVPCSNGSGPAPAVSGGQTGGQGGGAKANGKDKTQGNFKCEQCGRGFLFKNNLKAHLRTHTRDKKYTCDLCQKSFIYKESLKNHMLLHSNELPYLCDICGKKFRDRSNRRKHVKNVHKYMFVNGDINNPIPTAGSEGARSTELASGVPALAGSSGELKTKKKGGKKAQGDNGTSPPKPRNIIKSPGSRPKKSKNGAANTSVPNTNSKSVIVSMSSSSLLEGSSDRKIIMSPNPKNARSPSMEYMSHAQHSLPVTLHIPLAGPSGGSQFSQGRNVIVKASTIPSNHSMSPEMYLPPVDERGGQMQNVIVYPKSKIHHHPYSPAANSVISQNIHTHPHQQQQQYYREEQDESADDNQISGGYESRNYLGHGPSSVESLQHHQHQSQIPQQSRGYEYILSSPAPEGSHSPSNEDIKIYGSPQTQPGGSRELVGAQYSNLYPPPDPYHHPHGQPQQHYWINVGPPHPDNPNSPYSSTGNGTEPPPPGGGGGAPHYVARHPITSASNVLNVPSYGQPHASESVDPGTNVSNFYKDLSQFDFSYL